MARGKVLPDALQKGRDAINRVNSNFDINESDNEDNNTNKQLCGKEKKQNI